MNDSGFLSDLARTAREEEAEERRRWDRWDRLNDGDLSPEEEAELRALAATSEEDRRAFEAFRPLDSDFRARMVDTIGSLIAGTAVSEEFRVPDEAPVRQDRPGEGREETSRGWFTFPWWRLGFLGSGLTAATAAVFLMLHLPPLPQYTISELKSNVETSRGAEMSRLPTLQAGTEFTAYARPKTRITSRAKTEPRCYIQLIRPEKRTIRPVDCAPKIEPDERGSMIILGTLPEDLATGRAILWIVLSYRGDQPDPDEIEKLPTDRPTLRHNWDAGPTEIEIRAS